MQSEAETIIRAPSLPTYLQLAVLTWAHYVCLVMADENEEEEVEDLQLLMSSSAKLKGQSALAITLLPKSTPLVFSYLSVFLHPSSYTHTLTASHPPSHTDSLEVVRSRKWRTETDQKLSVLVQRLASLLTHEAWRVRLVMVQWSHCLLTHCHRSAGDTVLRTSAIICHVCTYVYSHTHTLTFTCTHTNTLLHTHTHTHATTHRTLVTCMPTVLEVLVTLTNDDYPQVSGPAHLTLVHTTNYSLCTSHDWVHSVSDNQLYLFVSSRRCSVSTTPVKVHVPLLLTGINLL